MGGGGLLGWEKFHKKFQLTVNVGRLGTFFIIINLDFEEFIVQHEFPSNNYYKNFHCSTISINDYWNNLKIIASHWVLLLYYLIACIQAQVQWGHNKYKLKYK